MIMIQCSLPPIAFALSSGINLCSSTPLLVSPRPRTKPKPKKERKIKLYHLLPVLPYRVVFLFISSSPFPPSLVLVLVLTCPTYTHHLYLSPPIYLCRFDKLNLDVLNPSIAALLCSQPSVRRMHRFGFIYVHSIPSLSRHQLPSIHRYRRRIHWVPDFSCHQTYIHRANVPT
ncbi:hypothetical protein C8F01DRAFT_191528 [Mycena amicta]|nr:hypothetical protein C8F01DRAFT_191528 [Mycena amicta]